MTIKDSLICPSCGNSGRIVGVQPLLENVRFDTIECECGTSWRAYYNVGDVVTEIVRVPMPEEDADQDNEDVAE